jgi:hypothetical protein
VSLYRQASGSRTRVLVIAAVAALIAAVAGYLIGRGSAPEPTLEELVTEARDDARPALSSLELVEIEYSESVDANGEVTAPTEYEAALDHAAAAAAAIDGAADLASIDPDGVDAARAAVAEVEDAMQAEASPDEVEPLLARARNAVLELSGDSQ